MAAYKVTRENGISVLTNGVESTVEFGETIELTENEAAPWLRDGWIEDPTAAPVPKKRGRKSS